MTKKYDFSNGSQNPYTVSARHNLLRPCLECGEDSEIIFDGSDYFRYFNVRGNVQDIFPYLNAMQRDLISVGIHPECSGDFYGRMVETMDANTCDYENCTLSPVVKLEFIRYSTILGQKVGASGRSGVTKLCASHEMIFREDAKIENDVTIGNREEI